MGKPGPSVSCANGTISGSGSLIRRARINRLLTSLPLLPLHASHAVAPDLRGMDRPRRQLHPVARAQSDDAPLGSDDELDAPSGAVEDLRVGVAVRAVAVSCLVRPGIRVPRLAL